MIFTKIEVENYGVFAGKHSFDLSPEKLPNLEKPIILFGGKNGSGKTTLFEAVRLCLYGNNFQGRRTTNPTYHKYLRQRIHRSSGDSQTTTASVSVEFNYAQAGRVDRYLAKRSWICNEEQTQESLKVYQNGTLLRDISEEQWQDFLMELIPLGVSKLFFFDGEQIQDLAEEEADNRYLISSLSSLLGLELVERLQTDLRIYLARKAKEKGKHVAMELTAYENRQKAVEDQLDSVLQKKAQVQSQIDRIRSEIEQQEHQIAKEGGGFASKREEQKALRNKLENGIETTKEGIRNLSSNLLPFALIPDLCTSLRSRLQDEEKGEQQKAAEAILDSLLEDAMKEMRSEHFWEGFGLPEQTGDELANRIREILRRKLRLSRDSTTSIVHHLSPDERGKLLDWIEKALNEVPTSLRQLTTRLEKLVRQRQEVDASLFRAPQDDVLNPLIQKLSNLHTELGTLQENHRSLDEDLRKAQYKLEQVKRQIEKSLETKTQLTKLSERMMLAKNVHTVLGKYIDRLRRAKLTSLSDALLQSFNRLSNKEHFIERVDIDATDFSVTLRGKSGRAIPKGQLAAGEKQIYAVAMLWALARTSGRPLPFIIDTPLGRLDAQHRENMVKHFFLHASHQVIVFSTDTEIDQEYFEELQPYVARAYHLVFDDKTGMTKTSVGYFWEGKNGGVRGNEFQQN